MGIKGMWKDLRTSPVDTLVRWQEQRFLWLLMAIAMGAVNYPGALFLPDLSLHGTL